MLDHELLDNLEQIQTHMAGKPVSRVYNEQMFNKLNDEKKASIHNAIMIVGDSSINPGTRMNALTFIGAFSKRAHDLETFNDTVEKWLRDEQYDCGVSKDGSIVLWDRENPASKISTKPVNFQK